jgi:hypothetical protein
MSKNTTITYAVGVSTVLLMLGCPIPLFGQENPSSTVSIHGLDSSLPADEARDQVVQLKPLEAIANTNLGYQTENTCSGG